MVGKVILLIIAIIIAKRMISKVLLNHSGRRTHAGHADLVVDGSVPEQTARQYRAIQRKDYSGEVGPIVYFANDSTDDGTHDKEYIFSYKKTGTTWRAYIEKMPDLKGRSDSAGTIHRLYSMGRYYICWSGNVDSLSDMQIISKSWADKIQRYIYTGYFV